MNFAETKDKALATIVVLVVTGAVSWCSWVTIAISSRPTQAEVRMMVEREAPYIKDRAMILRTLDNSQATNEKLREAIDNNTRVIIQLESLLKTKE